MRRHIRGFTLVELLIVVVILGILVSIVVPKFANGKERAMIAAMRSDLRNLVAAEEAHFANALTYYNGAVPNAAFAYNPTQNVTVTLSSVTASGWAATASHANTAATCAVFVGAAAPPPPATLEGQVGCTP